MNKYINAGIVKELTIYLKKEEDLASALSKLGEYLNLDLYDMKVYDQAVFLELDKSYIKQHLISFLREMNNMHIPSFLDYEKKIEYIEGHMEEDLDEILENCDDFFRERFRMQDLFSINDSSFCLDTVCYIFYFDGPYQTGNFQGLLQYLHLMQRSILKNPLKGALCFGLSE